MVSGFDIDLFPNLYRQSSAIQMTVRNFSSISQGVNDVLKLVALSQRASQSSAQSTRPSAAVRLSQEAVFDSDMAFLLKPFPNPVADGTITYLKISRDEPAVCHLFLIEAISITPSGTCPSNQLSDKMAKRRIEGPHRIPAATNTGKRSVSGRPGSFTFVITSRLPRLLLALGASNFSAWSVADFHSPPTGKYVSCPGITPVPSEAEN